MAIPQKLVIGSLAGAYLAFKILVPLFGWVLYICKGVAWLGFYIYFFQKAMKYGMSGVDYALGDGLEALVRELDKQGR